MGRKDERGWRTPISRWDSGTAPPLHSIGFGPSAPLAVGVGSALLMPVWGVPPFQQTNWGQPSVAAGVPGVPVCPGRHCWALTSEAPIPFRARAAQRWTPPRDGGGPPPPACRGVGGLCHRPPPGANLAGHGGGSGSGSSGSGRRSSRSRRSPGARRSPSACGRSSGRPRRSCWSGNGRPMAVCPAIPSPQKAISPGPQDGVPSSKSCG